jgi:hypothetical protein
MQIYNESEQGYGANFRRNLPDDAQKICFDIGKFW